MHETNHHNHHWNNNDGGRLNVPYSDDSSANFVSLRITYTLFLIGFIIPNIFLIVSFMRHHYYKHNFFYTMVHRSFANLLHMIFAVYMLYVPEDHKDEKLTLALLAVHCIVSGLSLTIATYFVFDKFINSTNFCVRTIRTNWITSILTIGIVLYLVCTNILNEFGVAIGYVVSSSLIMLIFIVRLLYFCYKGSEEENYPLRAWISGIFIFSTYIFTSWVIVEVLLGMNPPGLLTAALGIVLANGFLNSIILYKYKDTSHTREGEIAVPGVAQCYRARLNKNESPVVVEPDTEASNLSFYARTTEVTRRYRRGFSGDESPTVAEPDAATSDPPFHTRATEITQRYGRGFSSGESPTVAEPDAETSDYPFHTRATEITQRYRRGFNRDESPRVTEPDAEINDLPPKYDDEYEAPPNYEEAAKVAGIYKDMYQNPKVSIQETAAVYELPIYEEINPNRRYTQRSNENEEV